MSTLIEQLNMGQQANFKRDTGKLFIWYNRFESADYTNGTDLEITLPIDTVMDRIGATGQVTPLVSTATDGSQFPVGVLTTSYKVESGAAQKASICVAGDVDERGLIFSGSDTLDTIIAGRSLRDRIAADTLGIKLIVSDELTDFDNE